MRSIINYLRSLFCNHSFEYEETYSEKNGMDLLLDQDKKSLEHVQNVVGINLIGNFNL